MNNGVKGKINQVDLLSRGRIRVLEIWKLLRKINPAGWMKFLLYGILIVVLYQTALKQMMWNDWAKEDYTHCYLIPPLFLYLIWEKRGILASLPSVPSWTGLIPFSLGVMLFWVGELGGEFFILYLSLWLVIVGLCWLHLGWEKIKTVWFAFIMMLAMFPLPNFVNVRISLYLKLISSQLGVWLLQLYGMSAYREGNVIDLEFTQLQVVDACSGLRYLFPLMVLSLILAYWFKASLGKKIAIVLSTIPIAIFANSFRIALTGVLYNFFGPVAANGFFHGFSGWLLFLFTTGILLAEMWVLKKIRRRRVGEGDEGVQGNVDVGHKDVQQDVGNGGRHLLQPRFLALMMVLALTIGLSRGVEFREKIPIKKSFCQFPLQVGGWSGTGEVMEQEFVHKLQFSDYVIINYRDQKNHFVNFYAVYYETQQKGESIHSPETCFPMSGWRFNQTEEIVIRLKNGTSLRVNRVLMEKDGEQQLAYYWFPQRGRVLTKLYQLKLYNFWDALTRQRTDGALVRVVTPIAGSERSEDADGRIRDFLKDIIPLLYAFIPD